MGELSSGQTDDPTPATGPDADHRMPGWVKGFVLAGIVVGVLLLAALLLGTGSHGPQRHLPGTGGTVEAPAGPTAPAGADGR